MSTSAPEEFRNIPYPQKVEVDEICDRFEDAFKAGRRPNAEEFVKPADPRTWPTLIRELIHVEAGHRGADADVICREYDTRFPEDLRAALQSLPSFDSQRASLAPGSQLGDFRITHQIGAGGMGVVFEARDTKLDRDVALKILPSVFAGDTERLERFEREAKVLAALNHPNIATLYGFEEHNGIRCCVLELVPGETLAELLERRPLPLKDLKHIFGQIAAALEAAHARGIIHRDLKPANVKVTPDGNVKVLDFGLATSFPIADGEQPSGAEPPASNGNTVATAIAGTAPYMSPEQAQGKPIDKRTDVWAFGCCLYEALARRKAFPGRSVSEVLTAIVDGEPDWGALPGHTPSSLRFVMDRCLQKQPEKRLRDLGDAWIDDAHFEDLLSAATNDSPRRYVLWRWALLSLVCAVVAAIMVWRSQSNPQPAAAPTRWLTVNLPSSMPVAVADSAKLGEGRPSIAVTPDGSQLVYVANVAGVPKLCVRPIDREMDRHEAIVIEGTDDAFNPFISPDGQWVGFFAGDALKKVALAGGEPVILCDAFHPYGACWSSDGTIYFSESLGTNLSRVSDQGGKKDRMLIGTLANSNIWPETLPGSKGVLVHRTGEGIIHVAPTGEEELILDQGTHARYVASGHLVYALRGRLMAVPFDLDRMLVTGSAVPVVDDIRTESRGGAQFCTAQDGSLVYVSGGDAALATLVKREIRGDVEESLGFPPAVYGTFELSPIHGRRLAIVVRRTREDNDIWVFDLERRIRMPLTSDGNNRTPLWTPAGDAVVFSSDRHGKLNIFRKSAHQTGEIERLTTSDTSNHYSSHWFVEDNDHWLAVKASPDGENKMVSLDTKEERPLPSTYLASQLVMLSPHGHWIAYGFADEVWIQQFPGPGRKEQVSKDGGEEPVWAPAGDTLYYRNGSKWMAVAVETDPELKPGNPELLFESDYLNVPDRSYAITPDGKYFILLRGMEAAAPTQVEVVLNWFDELRRLAPARGN